MRSSQPQFNNRGEMLLNNPVYIDKPSVGLSDTDIHKVLASKYSLNNACEIEHRKDCQVNFTCPNVTPINCTNCRISKSNRTRALREIKIKTIERLKNA